MKRITTIIVYGIFSLFSLYPALLFAQKDLGKLKCQLVEAEPDTSKVWLLRDLAYHYQRVDPDSAIHYAAQGMELAERLGFPSGQIWCRYQQGIAFETKNRLDSALIIYNGAIRVAEESGDKLSKAKLLNTIGVAHYYGGNFHDAVLYYERGFRLSDSLAYREGMSYALNNMAVIYRLQRRYEQALNLYRKSLQIKTAEKDTAGIIASYYNKGLAFSYLDRHEESLTALTEAARLAEQYEGMVSDAPNITIGLGVAHYNLGNIAESRKHLEAGAALHPDQPHEKIWAMAYLGSIDAIQGRFQRGMSSLEEAYNLAAASGRNELLRTVLKERAKVAERMGDHRLALESWKEYSTLSDSLGKESSRWAMEEMQARFELLDKEQTISLQALQLEKETNQRKWYAISGILLLIGFMATALFLREMLRQRKQLVTEIAQKEEALEENNLLLREVHHRTKNNLQLLDSLLSLYGRTAGDDADAAKAALESSRDSVGAIGLLHRQLYQTKTVTDVSFLPYIRDLCASFQTAYSLAERNIRLRFHCDDLRLDIDKAIPLGLVINEMVTNAIKHGFYQGSGGDIDLRVTMNEQHLHIEVEDNGVGIIQSKKRENGTGKKLIGIFSRKFEADAEFVETGGGTLASFRIPLSKVRNL